MPDHDDNGLVAFVGNLNFRLSDQELEDFFHNSRV